MPRIVPHSSQKIHRHVPAAKITDTGIFTLKEQQ